MNLDALPHLQALHPTHGADKSNNLHLLTLFAAAFIIKTNLKKLAHHHIISRKNGIVIVVFVSEIYNFKLEKIVSDFN